MSLKVLTPEEVADLLKVETAVALGLIESGELPAFLISGGWRIRAVDLESWIDAQVAQSRNTSPRAAAKPGIAAEQTEEIEMHSEPAVSAITPRISQTDLHEAFIAALGKRVSNHGPLSAKPLEIDLGSPLPVRLRVYMFNATRPPGGRPLGEHKIQLIMPGQRRGERGSFDHGDERVVLLVGYSAEDEVFILWDAGLYSDFAWSRNVQVKAETIIEASAGKIATQFRQLRHGQGASVLETLIAAPAPKLGEAVDRRIQLSRQRLIEG